MENGKEVQREDVIGGAASAVKIKDSDFMRSSPRPDEPAGLSREPELF